MNLVAIPGPTEVADQHLSLAIDHILTVSFAAKAE